MPRLYVGAGDMDSGFRLAQQGLWQLSHLPSPMSSHYPSITYLSVNHLLLHFPLTLTLEGPPCQNIKVIIAFHPSVMSHHTWEC